MQRASVGKRTQSPQGAAEAAEPDAQLVRAVGIVGLKYGLAIDEDLATPIGAWR
jgi:hypothetical protein